MFRGRRFMSTVLAVLTRLTLRKTKNKILVSFFSCSVVLHSLESSRTDQIKYIVIQLFCTSNTTFRFVPRGEDNKTYFIFCFGCFEQFLLCHSFHFRCLVVFCLYCSPLIQYNNFHSKFLVLRIYLWY